MIHIRSHFSLYDDRDDSINVIKRDPKVQIKIKYMFDKYIELPLNFQSKIGYDILIKNVIPKELIELMGATKVDVDIKLK